MTDSLSRHQIGVNPYPNSITDGSNGTKISNCVTIGGIGEESPVLATIVFKKKIFRQVAKQ